MDLVFGDRCSRVGFLLYMRFGLVLPQGRVGFCQEPVGSPSGSWGPLYFNY